LEQLLVENHQQAEGLQMELPRRVPDKDMRSFLGLVSRIYVIEVENMDMREMNRVTAPLIHQRDLEAEALRLQIQMRDRIIKDQDEMLLADGVELLPKPPDWRHVKARPRPPTVPPPVSLDGPGFPPPLQPPPPSTPCEDDYIGAAFGFEPLDVLSNDRQPAATQRLQQLQQAHLVGPQSGMRKRRALSAGPLHLPPILPTGPQQGSGEAPPPQPPPTRWQPGNHNNRRPVTPPRRIPSKAGPAADLADLRACPLQGRTPPVLHVPQQGLHAPAELCGQAAASCEHRPASQRSNRTGSPQPHGPTYQRSNRAGSPQPLGGRGDAWLEECSQRPHAEAAAPALDNHTQPVGSLLQRRGRKKQRRAEAAVRPKRDRELREREPPLFLQMQSPGQGSNHKPDVALKQGGLPEKKHVGGNGNHRREKPGERQSSILS